MDWHYINLDFDGSIPAQSELSKRLEKSINLTDIGKSIRLWGSESQMHQLRERVRRLRLEYPGKWLTFYGSGDFNHVSSVLLETLPESQQPVHLVLLDNHPDWFSLPPKYHCGNWVATALRNKAIASALLMGQDSSDLKGRDFHFMPFQDLANGRLNIIPYSKENVLVPLKFRLNVKGARSTEVTPMGINIRFDTVTKLKDGFIKNVREALKGKNVYLAIDKDVLAPAFAQTDWDQGKMTLETLQGIITEVFGVANIVGIDVCGERAPTALRGIAKKVDAGRVFHNFFHNDSEEFVEATKVNQKTNLRLMDTLLHRLLTQEVLSQ